MDRNHIACHPENLKILSILIQTMNTTRSRRALYENDTIVRFRHTESVSAECKRSSPLFAKAPTTPKILFTSTRDGGQRDVYIMNPDGTEQENLTQHRAEDLSAVWSPTGEKILFVSDRGGVRDLYVMNPDGSNVRRVFKFKVEEWRTDPTWSPDGKQFAYEFIDWGRLKITLHIATLGEQDSETLVRVLFQHGRQMERKSPALYGERLTLINVRTSAKTAPTQECGVFST